MTLLLDCWRWEFAIIGVSAAMAALLLGNLAAWGLIAGLIDFRPAVAAALPWFAAAVKIPATTGLIAGW